MINSFMQHIEEEDRTVTGFNIGMKYEEVSAKTIFYCHINLIPRRD